MNKLNEYLVGGGGLPMKLIYAASGAEAVKAWRKKTGIKDGSDPSVSTVLERGQKKTAKKAAATKKAGGKTSKASEAPEDKPEGEQEVEG